MKKFVFAFALVVFFSIAACDNNTQNTGDTEIIQAEISQLEEDTELMEENTKELESNLEDLDASLDSLDILFPEEDPE